MARHVVLLSKDEAIAVAAMALNWMSNPEAGLSYGEGLFDDLVALREELMNRVLPMVPEKFFTLVSDLVDDHKDSDAYNTGIMLELKEVF